MSLIDLFGKFHDEAFKQGYPPAARLLYDEMLHAFNRAYWPIELVLTERQLADMTGLSQQGVNKAKHFLASLDWIIVIKCRSKTAYRLGEGTIVKAQSKCSQSVVKAQSKCGHRLQDNSVQKTDKTKTERRRAREESAEYEQPEESGIDLSEY